MFKTLVFLMAVLLVNTETFGQESMALRERCEAIVIEPIKDTDQEFPYSRVLWRARLLPFDKVEDFLVKGLAAEDIQVRFVAARVLLQKSPMNYQKAIENSLNELVLSESIDRVQRAAILAEAGNEEAKHELSHWAALDLDDLELESWICPMMCVKPTGQSGRCPVCAMELVTVAHEPDENDWMARVIAIRALQESGETVADAARSIITSDAPAISRLDAAGIWAQDNPGEALPHIKVFLKSSLHSYAIYTLAQNAPHESIVEFKEIIDVGTDDSFLRSLAWQGLLRAGETEYLQEIQEWVESEVTTESEDSVGHLAIAMLGELAFEEDIARLERLFDTEYKVFAAEAILSILERQQHK